MSTNLVKVPLVLLALGLVAGCADKGESTPVPAAAPAQAEAPSAAPAAGTEARPAVALVAYVAPAKEPAEAGHCELDAINGASPVGATAKVGTEALFGGWLADANNQVPTDARIVLKGAGKSYSVPLVAGVERADVATAYQAESLKLSGYNVLTTLDVAPGTYELSIVYGPGEAPAACAINKPLTVTD